MKKLVTLLFVSTMMTFAACQSKPKTEDTTTDTMNTMLTDTTTMATDSASTMSVDSTSTMSTDSAKK